MAAFLIVGAVGLVVLLLSALFDGVLDAFDFDVFDNGIVSTVSIAAFIAVFGFAGAIATSMNAGLPVALGVGSAAGVVAGALIGGITVLLRKAEQPEGTFHTRQLVGAEGTVVSPAPAGAHATVSLPFQGTNERFGAIADLDLTAGARIRVTSVISDTRVHVEPVSSTP